MPREFSQYSNKSTGWSAQRSKTGEEKEIFFRKFQTLSESRPDFRSMGTRGSLPWREEVGGVKLPTDLHLSPKLRMSGALPTFTLHEDVLRGKY